MLTLHTFLETTRCCIVLKPNPCQRVAARDVCIIHKGAHDRVSPLLDGAQS